MHKIGFWDIVLIVSGFVLIVFLVGYNSFTTSVEEAKNSLPTPTTPLIPVASKPSSVSDCVVITTPSSTAHLHFPITVQGTINGCNWQVTGSSLGTVTVLNAAGEMISLSYPISIESKKGSSYTFTSQLYLRDLPATSTGSLLFRDQSNAHIYQYPITF